MSSSTAPSGALSYSQVMALWEWAGGSPSSAPIAAAIAVCESSLNPGAIQAGQPYSSTGWGLWQITDGASVPASIGQNYQLLNPYVNAQAAVYKYNKAGGNFWDPWSADQSKYQTVLQSNATASTYSKNGGVAGVPNVQWAYTNAPPAIPSNTNDASYPGDNSYKVEGLGPSDDTQKYSGSTTGITTPSVSGSDCFWQLSIPIAGSFCVVDVSTGQTISGVGLFALAAVFAVIGTLAAVSGSKTVKDTKETVEKGAEAAAVA